MKLRQSQPHTMDFLLFRASESNNDRAQNIRDWLAQAQSKPDGRIRRFYRWLIIAPKRIELFFRCSFQRIIITFLVLVVAGGLPVILKVQKEVLAYNDASRDNVSQFMDKAKHLEDKGGFLNASRSLIWYDRAARSGLPQALYKSATLRLEGSNIFGLDVREMEMAVRRLYLAAAQAPPNAPGVQEALTALEKYEQTGCNAALVTRLRFFFAFSQLGVAEANRYFATLYLGVRELFDLGLSRKSVKESRFFSTTHLRQPGFYSTMRPDWHRSEQNSEERSQSGWNRVVSIAEKPFSSMPQVYLAMANVLDGKEEKGQKGLAEMETLAKEKTSAARQASFFLGLIHLFKDVGSQNGTSKEAGATSDHKVSALNNFAEARRANHDLGLLYWAIMIIDGEGLSGELADNEKTYQKHRRAAWAALEMMSEEGYPEARFNLALRMVAAADKHFIPDRKPPLTALEQERVLRDVRQRGLDMLEDIAMLGIWNDPQQPPESKHKDDVCQFEERFGPTDRPDIIMANFNLAFLYYDGEEVVSRDWDKALTYLRRPSQWSHEPSCRLWQRIQSTRVLEGWEELKKQRKSESSISEKTLNKENGK